MKGCNLGNWLMLEMWMLDYAGRGIADQYEFLKTHKTIKNYLGFFLLLQF